MLSMIPLPHHPSPSRFPTIIFVVLSAQVGKEGKGTDDIKAVTLTVCHSSMVLTRENLVKDFGIRETSVGEKRDDGVKIYMKDVDCPGKLPLFK